MTEHQNTTPDETPESDARTGQPTTEPRGNGPLDEEALAEGKENLESVKPY
jgi:hypothetical protein